MITRFRGPLSSIFFSLDSFWEDDETHVVSFKQPGYDCGYISPKAQKLIREIGVIRAIPLLDYAQCKKEIRDSWKPVIMLRRQYSVYKQDGLYGAKFSSGKNIVSPKYQHVFIDDNVVLMNYKGFFCVLNWNNGKLIYPFNTYEFMDDFEHGMSRVKSNSGWGIVDEYGNEVVACIYSKIWKFAGRPNLDKLHVEIDDSNTGYFTYSQLSETSLMMQDNPSNPPCSPNKYISHTIRKFDLENEVYSNKSTDEYGIDWREESFGAMTDGQYGDYEDGDIDPDCLGF